MSRRWRIIPHPGAACNPAGNARCKNRRPQFSAVSVFSSPKHPFALHRTPHGCPIELVGIYFPYPIDKIIHVRYNTNIPTSMVGLIHQRRAPRHEKQFPGSSAKKFSLWANVSLPDCSYGPALCCAHDPPLLRVRHTQSGSFSACPGFFYIQINCQNNTK